jgi:hypothetical protein
MEPMTLPPKSVRLVIGVLCGVVALSALAFAGAALFAGPKVNRVLLGFESVTLAASILGVLFARGKFQDGQGLAMACVAGTVFVAAVLGYLGSKGNLVTNRGDVPLKMYLLARVGCACVLGVVGAGLVLSRNARSWSYLWKSAATGLPVLAAAAAFVLSPGAVRGVLSKFPGWLAGMGLTVGGLLAVVLISASVHCLIRAFEMGKTETA